MWKTITTTNYATATDYAGINFFPGFTLTWEKRGKPLRPLIMQLPPILQTLISFQVLLDLGETLSIGGFLTLNHSPRLRRRYMKSIIINYGDVMVSTTRFWAVSCGRKRGWAILFRGEPLRARLLNHLRFLGENSLLQIAMDLRCTQVCTVISVHLSGKFLVHR